MFGLLYKHLMKYQTISLKHYFWEDMTYCIEIAMVIFSCTKITCYFYVLRYHMKLTEDFTGVYIIYFFPGLA